VATQQALVGSKHYKFSHCTYRILPEVPDAFTALPDLKASMPSAYISRSMGLFPNVVPVLFFTSSDSNPLMNRLKMRGLKLQPCLTLISQLNWSVTSPHDSFTLDIAFECIDCRIVNI